VIREHLVAICLLSNLSVALAQTSSSTTLPSDSMGFLYNNGTGTLSWSAGTTDGWVVSAPTPNFSPVAGSVTSGTTVTASCPEPAVCYASLDGVTLASSCSNVVTADTTMYARCEQAGAKPANASASYTIGGAPPPNSGVLAFGAELFNYSSGSTSTPPGICTLSSAVPVGATVVLVGMQDANDYHITAVTDSQGNSYGQRLWFNNSGGYQVSEQSIWSAPVTRPLTTNDTITITWSGSGLWRAYAVSIVYFTGSSSGGLVDSTATHNAYMYNSSVTIPGTTSSGNTIVIGTLATNDFVWTPGPGWTVYRSDATNIHYYFYYKVLTAAGSADPGGAGASFNTYAGAWAAFR